MKTLVRIIMVLAMAMAAAPALAGSLPPPGSPANGSGMPTLGDIYNQLNTGATAIVPAIFQEPSAGPTTGTGKSLSEIKAKLPAPDNTNGATAADVIAGRTFWGLRTDGTWGLQTGTSHIASLVCQDHWTGANCSVCTNGWSGANCNVAHPVVNKTGQTTSYGTRDDGALQYGIEPALAPTVDGAYNTPALTNSPRFTDNGDGTVTDNQTSLIWLKNANCFGMQAWANALTDANTLKGDNTQCGLNDGSTAGQWRLPNINELHSLGPAWPPGTPFTSVQGGFYWSSSTDADCTSFAWSVYMSTGNVDSDNKNYPHDVWPVRSGQ